MNKDNKFNKQITSKLDDLARHHEDKPVVINHVLEKIKSEQHSHFQIWKLSGFALAAAIAGFVVLPGSINSTEQPQNQVISTPKLSPQMLDDLDMLSVLGEDKLTHDS